MLKGILDQIYVHQGQLDTAKVNTKDLLKKKPDSSGYDILEDNVNDMKAKTMVFDPGGGDGWHNLKHKEKWNLEIDHDYFKHQTYYDSWNDLVLSIGWVEPLLKSL